eukprot:GHVT01019216.1.p2 GENE.GHVT01019216.1~~GHVT01019216.1.p2  ORF type:complete len:110 (+),score=4.94 GHVT01019216.1:1515-1844(+)
MFASGRGSCCRRSLCLALLGRIRSPCTFKSASKVSAQDSTKISTRGKIHNSDITSLLYLASGSRAGTSNLALLRGNGDAALPQLSAPRKLPPGIGMLHSTLLCVQQKIS